MALCFILSGSGCSYGCCLKFAVTKSYLAIPFHYSLIVFPLNYVVCFVFFGHINKTLYQKRIIYKVKWFWQIGLEFLLHFSWCLDNATESVCSCWYKIYQTNAAGDLASNNISWRFLCSAAMHPCYICLSQSIHTIMNHEPFGVRINLVDSVLSETCL